MRSSPAALFRFVWFIVLSSSSSFISHSLASGVSGFFLYRFRTFLLNFLSSLDTGRIEKDFGGVVVVRGTVEGAYNSVYLGVIFLVDCFIEIIFPGLFLSFSLQISYFL